MTKWAARVTKRDKRGEQHAIPPIRHHRLQGVAYGARLPEHVGHVWSGQRRRVHQATLHRAFELGINFLDTSASYGNGHNHELIGKAIKGTARPGGDPLEVGQPSGRRRHRPRRRQLARLPDPDLRGEPPAAGHRLPGHVLHVAHRPRRPRGGVGGRHGAAGGAGEDPLHRPVGSQRRFHTSRPEGTPRRLAADRVLALVPRRRAGQHRGLPRVRHGANGLLAPGPRLLRRRRPQPERPW